MTGRACHAIELIRPYVDVAVERWQAFTGETAMLDGDGRRSPTSQPNAAERAQSLMGRRAHQPDPGAAPAGRGDGGLWHPGDRHLPGWSAIDPKTLRKYYRDELDLGEHQGQCPGGGLPVQLRPGTATSRRRSSGSRPGPAGRRRRPSTGTPAPSAPSMSASSPTLLWSGSSRRRQRHRPRR